MARSDRYARGDQSKSDQRRLAGGVDNPNIAASWFETHGVAVFLTVRVGGIRSRCAAPFL